MRLRAPKAFCFINGVVWNWIEVTASPEAPSRIPEIVYKRLLFTEKSSIHRRGINGPKLLSSGSFHRLQLGLRIRKAKLPYKKTSLFLSTTTNSSMDPSSSKKDQKFFERLIRRARRMARRKPKNSTNCVEKIVISKKVVPIRTKHNVTTNCDLTALTSSPCSPPSAEQPKFKWYPDVEALSPCSSSEHSFGKQTNMHNPISTTQAESECCRIPPITNLLSGLRWDIIPTKPRQSFPFLPAAAQGSDSLAALLNVCMSSGRLQLHHPPQPPQQQPQQPQPRELYRVPAGAYNPQTLSFAQSAPPPPPILSSPRRPPAGGSSLHRSTGSDREIFCQCFSKYTCPCV